jgi:hypothetical protein
MIEQASLVIGNDNFAVKENSFLGYALNQNLYVPREMDVVRATTATLVNSEGLIEPVAYNLLSYSEQLNNAIWTKTAATINANATIAPNGTLTADKLIEDSTNATHLVLQSISFISQSSNYNYSVYLKAAERYKFRLRFGGFGGATDITGDLNAQTVSAGTLTNVGNGWFRCEFSVNSSTGVISPFIVVSLQDNSGNNTYLGNGTSGLFVWGAQVTGGSTVKTYFPTTDRLNIPRVDYSNGTPSILVEPQRTNLLLRSEEFNDAAWSKTNATITANSIISPSGIQNADKIVEVNGGFAPRMTALPTLVIGTAYTLSFYLKSAERNQVRVVFESSLARSAYFNSTTGVVSVIGGGATASMSLLNNGWYRCLITITPTQTNAGFYIATAENNEVISSGDNTKGIYIWGAQIELGSNATSYIPTVAAAVTRNADVINKTGISSLINSVEGCFYVEAKAFVNGGSFRVFSLSDGTANNRLSIAWSSVTNRLLAFMNLGGTIRVNNDILSFNQTSNNKVLFKWGSGNFKVFINGVESLSLTSVTMPTANLFNRLGFDLGSSGSNFEGNVNEVIVFPTQLTDQECINLTTL